MMSALRRFARNELPMLAGFAGAAIARSVIQNSYEARRGSEPPTDPSMEDVSWRDAVVWTVVLAAAGAVGRLLAQYSAGKAVTKATSEQRQQKG